MLESGCDGCKNRMKLVNQLVDFFLKRVSR